MSDQIALRPGDLPWEPHDSEPLEVYHYYDIPLVGLLEQHACRYIFRALIPPSLWAYAPVSDAEVASLESAGPNALEPLIDALFVDRDVTAAMTGEDLRIVVFGPFEHAGAPHQVASSAIAVLERELQHHQESLHGLAS